MSLKEEVLSYCNSLGLTNIGFIKCREFNELEDFYENRKKLNVQNEFEEEDIQKRINPNHYMEEGKTIISIAFPYLHDQEHFDNGFSLYTRGNDYHRVLKDYLDKICEFIILRGGKAISFVDSNTLPERYIAYLAGVGFIGKNNMLITKEYGSYVFLGEIITDLEMYDDDNGNFEELMKYTDLLLLDLKEINPARHKDLTGFDNSNIIEMAKYLSEINKPVWIRHVLVPEHSDFDEDLDALGDFIDTLSNVDRVEILPYHTLGKFKWENLGIPYSLESISPPSAERIENAKQRIHAGIRKQ